MTGFSLYGFLINLGFAAVIFLARFIGFVCVYGRSINKAGRFGVFSFLIAFIGSAMLLAQEWNQIFFVRDLAIRAPETMLALDAGKEFALPEIGSIIVFSFFALGSFYIYLT